MLCQFAADGNGVLADNPRQVAEDVHSSNGAESSTQQTNSAFSLRLKALKDRQDC